MTHLHNRGVLEPVAWVLPERDFLVPVHPDRVIAVAGRAYLVHACAHCHSCIEAIGVAHDPGSLDATRAAACHEEAVLVDVALGKRGVDTAHDVVEIFLTWEATGGAVGEIRSITDRAAIVDQGNDIAFGGQIIDCLLVVLPVGAVRAAVDPDDQRIFLLLVEVRR